MKWRPLGISAMSVCLAILLGWSLLGLLQLERASVELPRLFLQLERAIGYNGLIHNFKNFVLRPGEEAYRNAALEDYRQAARTIREINALTEQLQIETDLEAVESTLREYRNMLDIGRAARSEGLSILDVDQRVRVSDESALNNIQRFQQEIHASLDAQHRVFVVLLGIAIFTPILAALALTIIQFRKRREAEQYSASLAEKTAFILQAERIAKLGRWTIEPGGRMTWSQATMDICGVSEADFPGTTEFFWTIVLPDDKPKLRAAMNRAIETASQFVCVHRIHRSDDSMVIVVNSGEVTIDAHGEVVGFVGVLQDVTHLTDIEDKLRQSQKMEAIGNLAGGMAHDFNNILAVIVGNLDLLQTSADASSNERYINAALGAARNGAELTRSMLSFARQSPLEPKPLQINDLVRDVINWSGRLLPANIRVETSLLASLWQVEADRNLAQNALLNLLLNARDSMVGGGRLTIETSNLRIDDEYVVSRDEDLIPGRYVMLAVSDTGHGITEDSLQRVFDPFFSTKPPGAGSGLGLSMILGFMKQSGGTVRVYSEVDVGTTFKLYFKVTSKDPDPFRPAAVETSTEDLQGSRVLLVEDNAILLETLNEILAGAGFAVTTATSGDEALGIWSEAPAFDIVVTDIVMSGSLQGTHLAKALREQGADTPFIFMSGYSNEATVHGNGLRPEDIRLMKPISRLDIISAIVSLLSDRGK